MDFMNIEEDAWAASGEEFTYIIWRMTPEWFGMRVLCRADHLDRAFLLRQHIITGTSFQSAPRAQMVAECFDALDIAPGDARLDAAIAQADSS